jgi:hypothetical protein
VRIEIVLVIAEVSYDSLDGTILIEVDCCVQSVSVTEFLFFFFTFVHFIFVEDWVRR